MRILLVMFLISGFLLSHQRASDVGPSRRGSPPIQARAFYQKHLAVRRPARRRLDQCLRFAMREAAWIVSQMLTTAPTSSAR
jgi:hypothetical protein